MTISRPSCNNLWKVFSSKLSEKMLEENFSKEDCILSCICACYELLNSTPIQYSLASRTEAIEKIKKLWFQALPEGETREGQLQKVLDDMHSSLAGDQESFNSIQNIESLGGSRVVCISPPLFHFFSGVTNLRIQQSWLSVFPEGALEHLTHLQTFHFSNSQDAPIKMKEIPQELLSLQHLTKLTITDTDITELPKGQTLPWEIVDLSNNQLAPEELIEWMQTALKLQHLIVDNNPPMYTQVDRCYQLACQAKDRGLQSISMKNNHLLGPQACQRQWPHFEETKSWKTKVFVGHRKETQ